MSSLLMSSPPVSSERPKAIELRRADRFDCRCRCIVRPADATSVLSWPGMSANLSQSGIMLALQFPLQQGTRLVIEAWNGPGAPVVEATVVRSFPVGFAWFHGCEFVTPLSEIGLQNWLKSGVMRTGG